MRDKIFFAKAMFEKCCEEIGLDIDQSEVEWRPAKHDWVDPLFSGDEPPILANHDPSKNLTITWPSGGTIVDGDDRFEVTELTLSFATQEQPTERGNKMTESGVQKAARLSDELFDLKRVTRDRLNATVRADIGGYVGFADNWLKNAYREAEDKSASIPMNAIYERIYTIEQELMSMGVEVER